MKRSWIALFLTPCLTFAAYPIYENDFVQEEELLNSEQNGVVVKTPSVLQYGLAQEGFVDENAGYEEKSAPAPKKKRQSTRGSVRQKQIKAAKDPSVQRKQSVASLKQSQTRKKTATGNDSSSRSRVQESRQNSNRPRVTQRGNSQKRSENLIEADAQSDSNNYVKKDSQEASRAKKQTSHNQKNAAVSRHSHDSGKKGSFKTKLKARKLNKGEHNAQTHHPGTRPMSN